MTSPSVDPLDAHGAPAPDPDPAAPAPRAGGHRPGRRRARRRRIAWALVAWGSAGLLLAAASLVLALRALSLLDAVDRQRAEIVRWLDVSAASIADVQQGAGRAGLSLQSAAAAARDAAALSDDLSGTMASLRETSAGLSILGTHPLEPLTGDLDRVSGRAHALASSMTSLAGSLDANTADFATVSADAATLRSQVTELRAVLAGDGADGATASLSQLYVAVLLLLLWFALPAVASLGVGLLWLRETGGPAVPA